MENENVTPVVAFEAEVPPTQQPEEAQQTAAVAEEEVAAPTAPVEEEEGEKSETAPAATTEEAEPTASPAPAADEEEKEISLEDGPVVDEHGNDVNQSEVEIERRAAMSAIEMAPKPTAKLIEQCRAAKLEDIAAVDKAYVERGMALFFSNQYVEAEAVFKEMQGKDPLVAASLAVLYSMRAVLSMEQQYINQACAYLLFASHFAKDVIPPKKGIVSSALSGMTKWFKPSKELAPMSPSAFRSSVVMAEAEVLRGTVLILEETFSSYLKAGLALRRAYNIYDSLQKHLEAYQAQQIAKGKLKKADVEAAVAEARQWKADDESVHVGLSENKPQRYAAGFAAAERARKNRELGIDEDDEEAIAAAAAAERAAAAAAPSAAKRRYGIDIDNNSYFAMHFGLGCIHITTSILPEKVLKILTTLGYMHDRAKGFDHMQQCLNSGTIRAPLASLFMMGFHGVLPSFTPLMLKDSLPAAARVDRATKRLFPKSVIHLWVSGRVNRLAREPLTIKHKDIKPSLDTYAYGNEGLGDSDFGYGDAMTADTAVKSKQQTAADNSTNDDVEIFQRCVAEGARSSLAKALPQLKDIALYDLAWSFVSRLEWFKAAMCFKILEESSMWSKCFYAYAQGACWEMYGYTGNTAATTGDDGDDDETREAAARKVAAGAFSLDAFFADSTTMPAAPINGEALASQCYWRAIGYKTVKLGGKEMSIDQFVFKRVKRMIEVGKKIHQQLKDDEVTFYKRVAMNNQTLYGGEFMLKNTTMGVCGLELAMFFSMLTQMRHDNLLAAQAVVERTLQSKMLKGIEFKMNAKDLKKVAKRAAKKKDASGGNTYAKGAVVDDEDVLDGEEEKNVKAYDDSEGSDADEDDTNTMTNADEDDCESIDDNSEDEDYCENIGGDDNTDFFADFTAATPAPAADAAPATEESAATAPAPAVEAPVEEDAPTATTEDGEAPAPVAAASTEETAAVAATVEETAAEQRDGEDEKTTVFPESADAEDVSPVDASPTKMAEDEQPAAATTAAVEAAPAPIAAVSPPKKAPKVYTTAVAPNAYWRLGNTHHYKRLFRRHNAGLKEDLAAVMLMYATISREVIRTAEMSNERAAEAKNPSLAVALPTYTYDDVMAMYQKVDEAVKKIRAPKKSKKSSSGKKGSSPADNDEYAATTSVVRPVHPLTGLIELPSLGLKRMSAFNYESWVLPHATYEKGVTRFYQGKAKECKQLMGADLKHVVNGKDYSFEMVMQFRLHLGSGVLKAAEKAEKNAEKN